MNFKSLLNFFLILLTVIPCKAEKLILFLNLKKGATYYMVGASNSTILQTVNGQQNKVNLTLSYRMAFKVINANDYTYNMDVSYQFLDMKVLVANRTIEMDSRKRDNQDISSDVIKAMMNKPFSIIMTKSGKIKSIKNIKKIIISSFDNFPQIDEVKKAQIKNQLLQNFGGNTFKGNLELQTAIFPEIPLSNGNKWAVNTKLDGTVKANVRTTYQLIDSKEGHYHLRGVGSIGTNKNLNSSQINGMPVKYNLIGTSTSDIKVDKVTGWINEVRLKQTMKGNIEILDNPKVPGGAKIPMTFVTEVRTTDK